MENISEGKLQGKLHKALGLKDLTLLNIVCIVSVSTLAQVAQLGYASLPLMVLFIFTFLIPSGLVVSELNARMPEEGGFYLWTQKAFGDFHGYVTAWCYWLCNIVWFATILMLVTVPALYLFGDKFLQLAENSWYNGIFGLIIIWLITILNIIGIERAKWLQNIGGVSIWIVTGLLLVVGITYASIYGIAHPFESEKLILNLSNIKMLPYIALVAFSFGGLELAPIMDGEIKDPKRNIPKAIINASIVVSLVYLLGVLMLILIIPEGKIDEIAGIAQAFYVVNTKFNIAALGVVGPLLVVLCALGMIGSWMTGNARIPFVIGLDNYLPNSFAKVHPKFGSPVVSLIVQAIVVSVLFILSLSGSTVKEAFFTLLDMSIVLYFIPFLYIFAAFAMHTLKNKNQIGLFSIFKKNKISVWVITVLGFSTTLMATVLSCIPTDNAENGFYFTLKVVGGAILLIGAGLVVFYYKKYLSLGYRQ